MKLLFVLLAACVATLVLVVVAVFLRIRKHRREEADASVRQMVEEIDSLPTGQEHSQNKA